MDYARDHLNRMVIDFEALGYNTTYKVLNGIHFGVPQKRQRVFIVSVREDVMDDIGMSWMLLSSVFPEPVDEEPTLEDAIGDLKLDNENSVEAVELCEAMKKSAKYKWLKRLPKNPDKVVSVGDDVVGPWYDKVIAHRKKMGKSIPEEDRVYTTKESKRIMTLPEDYILTGTLNEKLARIGLMVAPICMKYVAESVYQNILEPWNEVHNRTN
jgi:DNA (cytosine-5)-methyltransferase 1